GGSVIILPDVRCSKPFREFIATIVEPGMPVFLAIFFIVSPFFRVYCSTVNLFPSGMAVRLFRKISLLPDGILIVYSATLAGVLHLLSSGFASLISFTVHSAHLAITSISIGDLTVTSSYSNGS